MTENEPSKRPHDKARSKNTEGGHERSKYTKFRKKERSNGRRKIPIKRKVIPFQGIPNHAGKDDPLNITPFLRDTYGIIGRIFSCHVLDSKKQKGDNSPLTIL